MVAQTRLALVNPGYEPSGFLLAYRAIVKEPARCKQEERAILMGPPVGVEPTQSGFVDQPPYPTVRVEKLPALVLVQRRSRASWTIAGS